MTLNRRNFLKGIGAALAAGSLPACIQRYFVVTPDVTVRSYPHYSISNRSQEEGEEDLVRLARSHTVKEDVWLFLDYNNRKGQWFEVGVAEKLHSAAVDVGLINMIQEEAKKPSSFTWYHIHPFNSVASFYNGLLLRVGHTKQMSGSNGVNQELFKILSFPSPADIICDLELRKTFNEKNLYLKPSGVVTPMVTYEFSYNDLSKDLDSEKLNHQYALAIIKGYADNSLDSTLSGLRGIGVNIRAQRAVTI